MVLRLAHAILIAQRFVQAFPYPPERGMSVLGNKRASSLDEKGVCRRPPPKLAEDPASRPLVPEVCVIAITRQRMRHLRDSAVVRPRR